MEKKDSQKVFLLVRDGTGEGTILRIKSSFRLSDQKNNKLVKVKIGNPIPKDIGYLAKNFVMMVHNRIPSVKIISFRRYQIILNFCFHENWTENQERKVIEIINSLIRRKNLIPCWFVQRKIGDEPRPIK